jgi:hypothetical protein
MGEGDCIVEKPAVAPYCRSGLTNPVGRNGRRRQALSSRGKRIS